MSGWNNGGGVTAAQEETSMLGALIMALVLLIGLPVTCLLAGTAATMALGQALWSDGEVRAHDTEIVELNR